MSFDKRKSDLEKAFESANSVAEKIDAFQRMVSVFQDSELAPHCWSVIHSIRHNPSNVAGKVYTFGKMALSISIINQDYVACVLISKKDNIDNTPHHSRRVFIACILELLGTSCYHLKRFGECLRYLNSAVSALQDNNDNTCVNNCVRRLLIGLHRILENVKVDMGETKEAVVHAVNALDLMKLTVDENSIDLCNMYSNTYKACVAALDAKQAIPLCEKALDFCVRLHPEGSSQVASVRVHLAALYCVVGEPEKVDPVWLNTCHPYELLKAKIQEAKILYLLDRQKDALAILRPMILRTDVDERGKFSMHLDMAKSYCKLTKFIDVVHHITEANKILEINNFDSLYVGNACLDISGIYEMMNDKGNALHWLKRVCELCVKEIHTQGQNMLDHQKLLVASSKAFFSLISVAGQEEFLFMNSVAEKLEQVFGQNHRHVGYGYARLGKAFMKLGREDLALQWLTKAKDIMNGRLGPHHMDSLRNMHTLSQAYVKMGAAVTEMVNEHSQGLEPKDHQQVLQ